MKRFRTVVFGLSLVLLILILSLTNPYMSPLFIVIIPFFLALIAIYSFLEIVMDRVWPRASVLIREYVCILASIAVVVTLALSSLGQLSAKDVAVVSLIAVCGLIYVLRFRSQDPKETILKK
jgi:hypothetical protein